MFANERLELFARVFFSVLQGRSAYLSFEQMDEMRGRVEAEAVRYLRYGKIAFYQKHTRRFYLAVIVILYRRFVCVFFE